MSKRFSLVGAAAAAIILLASATSAPAQIQSPAQQKCLNALNKDGAAVARTQGKENVGCVKTAGKTTTTGAQACLAADAKGKVGKAQAKTSADETKLCGTPPGIGYTSAAAINTAAKQGEIDLTADVFGPSLDTALVTCATNKAACACQQKVQKGGEQLAAVRPRRRRQLGGHPRRLREQRLDAGLDRRRHQGQDRQDEDQARRHRREEL
jgi:hypothetical protein